jgi:hypothetical protein
VTTLERIHATRAQGCALKIFFSYDKKLVQVSCWKLDAHGAPTRLGDIETLTFDELAQLNAVFKDRLHDMNKEALAMEAAFEEMTYPMMQRPPDSSCLIKYPSNTLPKSLQGCCCCKCEHMTIVKDTDHTGHACQVGLAMDGIASKTPIYLMEGGHGICELFKRA